MDYSLFLNAIKQGYVGDIPASLLWKYILLFLKEQTEPFFESDFDNYDAFLDYIQQQADLQDYWNGDSFDSQDVKNFWNESVAALVDLYNHSFGDEQITESTTETLSGATVVGRIPYGEGSFNTEDLKNADAGRAFSATLSNLIKWVRPWYNIDFAGYSNVRGDNVCVKAVSEATNIGFTREFTDSAVKWMRLLMPYNSRRVEVEDLNRNFWVISSVLGAVCSYLFDDRAPIMRLVKGMLGEQVQLWENTLCLWAALAALSQKRITGIKTIVFPIYVDENRPYKKYDDGYGILTKAELETRLQPLIRKYSHTHLCIVPYFRDENYYRNYYKTEAYRYICFYNATTEKLSIVPLQIANGWKVDFVASQFQGQLYAIRETPTYYRWTYPLSAVGTKTEADSTHRYCGGIRVVPEVSASMGSDGKIKVDSFVLSGYDAAREAIEGESPCIIQYSKPNNVQWDESAGWSENPTPFIANKITAPADKTGIYDIYDAALNSALYFGEFPSWTGITLDQPTYTVLAENTLVGNGYLLKIGNFLPAGLLSFTSETKEWTDLIEEQSAPKANGPTAYLANLTIKGTADEIVDITTWYGGQGAGAFLNPSSCKYYVSQFENDQAFYDAAALNELTNTNSMGYVDYDEVTLPFLERNGWDVVKNYISNMTFDTASIAYFITAVGLCPWHNTPANLTNGGTYQGYWMYTLLAYSYRFVPVEHREIISTTAEEVYKGHTLVGYVECLGEINRTEYSFDNVFKIDNGTTWRLPRLFPEQQVSSMLAIQIASRSTIEVRYLDVSEHPELREAHEQGNDQIIIDYLIDPTHPEHLLELQTEDSLRTDYFENPSGTWTVYDGNVNTTDEPARVVGNMEYFDTNNSLRQAIHMEFTFDFEQSPARWENHNTKVRNWDSTTPVNLADYPTQDARVSSIWSAQHTLNGLNPYSPNAW